MSIVVTTRSEPLIGEDGLAGLRFAELLENLVNTVNALTALPINTQNDNYTFILTDVVVRKISATTQQEYTIPSNDSVAFDIGTQIEVQNDGSAVLDVDIEDDTLTFEEDNTTGKRIIAAGGSGRFLKVAATEWKCRGEQIS